MHGYLSSFALLAAAALLATGCNPLEEPREAPLAQLVALQDDHDGRTVITEGEVKTFEEPRHYWIEDDRLNRVGLVPDEAAREHLGQRVRITGRFHYSAETGRRIEVEEISALPSDE